MPRVIAFDVTETLLDLSALDPPFERALGSAALNLSSTKGPLVPVRRS